MIHIIEECPTCLESGIEGLVCACDRERETVLSSEGFVGINGHTANGEPVRAMKAEPAEPNGHPVPTATAERMPCSMCGGRTDAAHSGPCDNGVSADVDHSAPTEPPPAEGKLINEQAVLWRAAAEAWRTAAHVCCTIRDNETMRAAEAAESRALESLDEPLGREPPWADPPQAWMQTVEERLFALEQKLQERPWVTRIPASAI